MNEVKKTQRTRVAPSPTGDPHVGTAYQALFDVAWVRQQGGQFVLRIEDTDQNRLVAGSEQQIYDSLRWLGLDPDESPEVGGAYGPYRQSERLDTYRPYVEQLLAAGHAYYCWCSAERLKELRAEQEAAKVSETGYDRLCYHLLLEHGADKVREVRSQLPGFSEMPVVRMLVPEDAPLSFTDLIRGSVNAPFPDDQVILKADGFPTYHLAVVVDDHLMGITTVVRGEEWISSTPKHLLLYRWLGWEPPAFAHMPLLRNTDHSKISKRKNPAARLLWFREQGYLPEALLNFLQLLGYPPVREDSEMATLSEFVAHFDWAKISTVGPVFDTGKLDWLNGAYIRALDDTELAHRIAIYEAERGRPLDEHTVAVLTAAVPIIKERITLLSDALPMIDYLLLPAAELVIADDARAALPENTAQIVSAAVAALETLTDWNPSAIQDALRSALVETLGLKPKVAFNPIRTAIAGRKVSPPLFESMAILGQPECQARLSRLI
ncbi:MAG: glutamate--tRNA ligase [Propionibacteriaceae bacterium]|jgi:glutamyl-tRNA synthetase|nr:glutamate--tRNA ligase [Propionibacteriaceae bacterium]